MPFTRRTVLLAGSTLPLLSGCTQLDGPSTPIVEMDVVLVNGRAEPLTFRFVLETTDGLGAWSVHEVAPEDRKSVTVEPPANRDVVGIRALVAGYSAGAGLFEYDSDAVCPRVYIEFGLADTPTIVQPADVSC